MKAMVITGFGGPEVFAERDLPEPEPAAGQVLVRVHAASINPVDYKIRKNGSWAGITPPAIIGYDVAGVIESIGAGVQGFRPGDEVFYTSRIFGHQGAYAEYHCVEADIIARKPRNLDFVEAASLPLAGCTALDAMGFLDPAPGRTVLIHAGAGGVGSLAVQMARAAGARVIATCSARNKDLVHALGADVQIDYRSQDFAEATKAATDGEGVDGVFDTVGGDTLARSIAILRNNGKAVSIVNTDGDLNEAYFKNISIYFEFLVRAREKMEVLRTIAERGQIRPVIDTVLPLHQVAEGHRRIEGGGMRGKVVLQAAP